MGRLNLRNWVLLAGKAACPYTRISRRLLRIRPKVKRKWK